MMKIAFSNLCFCAGKKCKHVFYCSLGRLRYEMESRENCALFYMKSEVGILATCVEL